MYVMISQLRGAIKIRSHDQKRRKTDILNFGDLYFLKVFCLLMVIGPGFECPPSALDLLLYPIIICEITVWSKLGLNNYLV